MRILKPALIVLVAASLAASGAFARAGHSAHGKKSGSSVSGKRKKSSSGSHSRREPKRRSSARHEPAGEHFRGGFDIPPEELPEPEDDDSTL